MRRHRQLVQPNLPKQAFAVAVGGGCQVSAGMAVMGDQAPPSAAFQLEVVQVDDVYGFSSALGSVTPSTYLNGTFDTMAVDQPTKGCLVNFSTPAGTPLTGPGGSVTSLLWTFGGVSVVLSWSGAEYSAVHTAFADAIVAAVGTTVAVTLTPGYA